MMNLKTNNKTKITKIAAFGLILALFQPASALALTDQQRLNQINLQLKNAQSAKNQAASQSRTLQSQVTDLEAQITQTEAAILATSAQIESLTKNIAENEAAIVKTEAELKEKRDKLSEILRVSYEESQVSIVELVAGSDSFSDFISRKQYIDEMQLEIKEITNRVLELKRQLEAKKKQLEEEKKKAEELKASQEVQKRQIEEQKAAKEHLLSVTKGNEANYQKMATDLKVQYDALQTDIWRKAAEAAAAAARARQQQSSQRTGSTAAPTSSGGYVNYGSVRAGDIIGYQGNSGFSSGTHLHFEIRNSAQGHVNPGNYIGNGYFNHPLPGSRMTQGYGYTTWWAYSFHTGWDLSAGYGAPIRATAPGEVILRVTGKGNTYPGSLDYGNYVIIRHTNGMYSLYAHLR